MTAARTKTVAGLQDLLALSTTRREQSSGGAVGVAHSSIARTVVETTEDFEATCRVLTRRFSGTRG